jgi:hypothetical protein
MKTFFFDDSPVGYFMRLKYPTKDGDYRYEAFRGYGHYEMQQRLKESGSDVCYYDVKNKRVFFTVRKSAQGVLTLSNFERKTLSLN